MIKTYMELVKRHKKLSTDFLELSKEHDKTLRELEYYKQMVQPETETEHVKEELPQLPDEVVLTEEVVEEHVQEPEPVVENSEDDKPKRRKNKKEE